MHKYQYAELNPVNNFDPSGFFTISEKVAIGVGINLLIAATSDIVIPKPLQTPTESGDFAEPNPYKTFFEIALGLGSGIVQAQVLAKVFSSAIDDVVLTIPQSVGANVAPVTVTSSIKNSPYAIRLAQSLSQQAQRDVNDLVAKLLQGNPNAGLGSRALGQGFFELRGANAGRVIVKQISSTRYDIVGKFQGHVRGDRANSEIIQRLMREYSENP